VIARPKHVCPAARHAKEFFMKNLHKLLGIAALALAIVFSMTGCPTESKNDSGSSNREELSVSGKQVYTEFTGKNPYTGSFTLDLSRFGGTGEVKDGKLTFKVGTPSGFDPISHMLVLYPFDKYKDIKANPDSVQVSPFIAIFEDNSIPKRVVNEKDSSAGWEQMMYVYVDGDVTVTGTGMDTDNNPTQIARTKNITLALKKGWNTLCEKHVYSGINVGGVDKSLETRTLSLSNSPLLWVYYDN
jgi:hypothetical protein